MGAVVGFVLAFTVGAAVGVPGRYQIAADADDLYMLDTATGEIWRRGYTGNVSWGTLNDLRLGKRIRLER